MGSTPNKEDSKRKRGRSRLKRKNLSVPHPSGVGDHLFRRLRVHFYPHHNHRGREERKGIQETQDIKKKKEEQPCNIIFSRTSEQAISGEPHGCFSLVQGNF